MAARIGNILYWLGCIVAGLITLLAMGMYLPGIPSAVTLPASFSFIFGASGSTENETASQPSSPAKRSCPSRILNVSYRRNLYSHRVTAALSFSLWGLRPVSLVA
jgi:hypothetical protein